jgi:GntR family histidine utilization transcriptional repressor
MAKPVSLHQKIRSDIEGKILSGDWAPGFRIPVEHELMERYECARMTVSTAIASLVEAGLIVRRKRGGSFVAEPHIQSVLIDIPDIKADIKARGAAYGLKLLSRDTRMARSPEENKLAGGGLLLAVKCVHLANGKPFAAEDRLISLKSVPAAAKAEFTSEPPGTWLLAHVPWTEAENRIFAINASKALAKTLSIGTGESCLVIKRRTWRGRDNITEVEQSFPGSAFELIARFAPRRT